MALTSFINMASEAFMGDALEPCYLEVSVLTVFAVSFLVWRHINRSSAKAARGKKQGKKVANDGHYAGGSKQHATARGNWQQRSLDSHSATSWTANNKTSGGNVDGSTLPLTSQQTASLKAAEAQMLQHLEQCEFTRALNMYRSFERNGRDRHFSEELFHAFIQSAIRVGKLDVVERLLRTMRRNQCKPSLDFWLTTLKMLSSRKKFSACVSVYALFGKQIPKDKAIYSCLINASLEVGDAERAMGLLERYEETGLEAKDYVLFFRTYVASGAVDAAEACFHKLDSGATTLMLNLLLLTCVNATDATRANRILGEAHAIEDSGGIKIVDIVSYNTVFKGFAREGRRPECFDCLQKMLQRGFQPDDITFGTLLEACFVDQDLSAANEVVAMLMGGENHMDTGMFTLFIKALLRAKCVPMALALYDHMKRVDGAHPDVVTYCVLIKALVDKRDLDHALHLLNDLVEAGLTPDDIILTHLLEGCRHMGKLDLGKKLFSDMMAAGVKPSEITLVTMLKLYGKCGAHAESYDLVATWEEKYGIKPSVIHYTCVMSGCLRTKMYDQAWAAYELMCSRDITADETTVSTLLPGLIAGEQWAQVLTVAQRALTGPKRIDVPAEMLNSALSQMMASNGFRREAQQLKQLMIICQVPMK
jgi:pentatricopeptide repeat protein